MNRREFFAGLAPALVSGRAAERTSVASEAPASGLEPYVPSVEAPWDYMRAAHLLRRGMSGPTEEEIRRALKEGPEATVERLLQPFEPSLRPIALFAWGEPNSVPPEPEGARYDAWVWEKLGRRFRLTQWWVQVMVQSPVSMQERMTFFWHDHFATQLGKVEFAEFAFVNNQLLRSHATGNFREMTRAVTKDPAVLTYLDGEINTRFSLNENYARELLELFTTGRADQRGNPNYTQEDVVAAARALTGWSKQPSKTHPGTHHSLESRFWPHLWDDGNKTFLGRTGAWNADDIVDIIFQARADQVARHICGKLYRLLVSMTPDESVIAGMAETFRQNDWEIAPVLRRLLLSAHFYDAENIGVLPKTLLDYSVGLIRSLGLQEIPDFIPTTNTLPYRDLFFRLEGLEHLPFHPPNVSGWPEGRAWVTPATLVPRVSFAADVALGRVKPVHMPWPDPMYTFDPVGLARRFPDPDDIHALCDDMALHFLGIPPSPKEREILFAALLDGGRDYEWDIAAPEQRAGIRIRLFLKALFALPKFQLS